MSAPVIISIPHQLGRAEARRFIEAGSAKIVEHVPGNSGAHGERRDGDCLSFRVSAMG